VKRFNRFFKATLLAFLCSLTTSVNAELPADSLLLAKMDSVEISLLTCGPGQEAYELYGHTALRIEGYDFPFTDSRGREHIYNDVAVNWGLFSFKAKFFYLKFIFGLTDYTVGMAPMFAFLDEYEEEGRWVRQQKLNLQPDEKLRIIDAVIVNNLPENRFYRYNYFYDNCTTRADRMIANHLNNKPSAHLDSLLPRTYRENIHAYNTKERWARMGNDLLLGLKADRPISEEQSLFLPINLMNYYEGAQIQEGDSTRKLVSESELILADDGRHSFATYNTPLRVFGALFILLLIITGNELKYKRNLWLLDAVLLSATALGGLILTAMLFSQHPTVRLNLQILLFNPITLIGLWPAVGNARKNHSHWLWKCYAVCILLFFLGNIFQDYAEATNFLALSLLIRCCRRIFNKAS